jgi:ParB family chromosome partitioning protein
MMDEKIIHIPLHLIERDPEQPRTEFDQDYILGLSESIKTEGLKNPIHVRIHPEKDGYFMLVNGECRTRAATLAGLQEIKTIVKTYENIADLRVEQALDNITRKSMPIMDEIKAVKNLLDLGKTLEEISSAFGKSAGTLEEDLKILTLKEKYQKMVNAGTLSKAVARKFSEVDKGKQDQVYVKHIAKKQGSQAQIKAIEAYLLQSRQLTLEFDLETSVITGNDRKEMQQFLVHIIETSKKIADSPYSNGKAVNLIKLNKKRIPDLEIMASTMVKFGKHIQDNILAVKAACNM